MRKIGMLKNEQNIAFTGVWANFKMSRALNVAVERRNPVHTKMGKQGSKVSLHTPFKEVRITERVAEEVDRFVTSKPNKKSFKIAEKIAKAFPLIKPELSTSTGKKLTNIHPVLQKTLEELSELRKSLHVKLNKFVEEKGIKK